MKPIGAVGARTEMLLLHVGFEHMTVGSPSESSRVNTARAPIRRTRTYIAGFLLAGVALVAIVLITGAMSGKARSLWSFGPFAGYVWRGNVEEISASWTVPRILKGSPPEAVAATWIGATSRGASARFIQVGANEQSPLASGSAATSNDYFAFWSDVKHGFRPQILFQLKPGDEMSASLRLARKRWTLTIVDATSRVSSRFTTSDEGNARFGAAEWTQEDVTDEAAHKPFAYPRLSLVRFTHLQINTAVPTYAQLYSTWMSVGETNIAPSPLAYDSFSLSAATVDLAGERYLRIATREDAATISFVGKLMQWSTHTSRSAIASSQAGFAAGLRANIRALLETSWPVPAQSAMAALVQSVRVLLALTQSPVPSSGGGIALWRSTWTHEATAIGSAAHVVKRILRLPEIKPVT